MNILIVVPRYSKKGVFYPFPFGLAYISSYLKSKGFNVLCLNLCHFDEFRTTADIIKEFITKNPVNAVLTGGMSGHWDLVKNVIDIVKKLYPDMTTIMGGPILTSDPELVMDNMDIDYGVIGEGEITAGELISALSENKNLSDIDGLIYRKNGRLAKNRERSPILNLDSLPFPDYESLDYGEWQKLVQYSETNPILENFDNIIFSPIIGSRSCPFSCTFCYHPLGNKYRQRSLDNIFSEIDFLKKRYGTNFISFSDELFSANADRMYEFADRLKKYNIKWDAQFRVNNVTKEMVVRLKKSNLTYMGYGVESLSDRILVSMKKMITRAEIENAFKLTHEERIYASGNIILGDPAETLETMNESINWFKEHPEYCLGLRFIKAIPDAVDYQYALKNSLINDKVKHIRNDFPVVNMTKIPDEEFNKIKDEVSGYSKGLIYTKEARLVKSEKLHEQYQGNIFYSLSIECPFCGQTKQYKKFSKSNDQYVGILCKNCCSPFKIKRQTAFYDNNNYFSVLFYKPLYKIYDKMVKKGILNQENKIIINLKNTVKKIFGKK